MKVIYIIILILVYIANPQNGSAVEMISGSAELNNKTFDSLTINGSLTFDHLLIKDILKVNGSANGNNLKCGKFIVSGALIIKDLSSDYGKVEGGFYGENVYIKNDLNIEGAINGKNIKVLGITRVAGGIFVERSNFKDIEFEAAEEVILINSKARNILARKSDIKQKLKLKNKTIIFGNIVFESGNGEIYLSHGSKIEGTVKGAVVVNN